MAAIPEIRRFRRLIAKFATFETCAYWISAGRRFIGHHIDGEGPTGGSESGRKRDSTAGFLTTSPIKPVMAIHGYPAIV